VLRLTDLMLLRQLALKACDVVVTIIKLSLQLCRFLLDVSRNNFICGNDHEGYHETRTYRISALITVSLRGPSVDNDDV
jgi:hypothetical protein